MGSESSRSGIARVSVVGSREYPRLDLVRAYVETLPVDTLVISGGAKGVDREAMRTARKRDMPNREIKADWQALGKGAGLARNLTMIAIADEIIAFWDGASRGTDHTVRNARKAGKPVTVYGPNGEQQP